MAFTKCNTDSFSRSDLSILNDALKILTAFSARSDDDYDDVQRYYSDRLSDAWAAGIYSVSDLVARVRAVKS